MKTSTTHGMIRISLILPVFFFISLFIFKNTSAQNSSVTDAGPVNTCYDLSDHKVQFITTEPGVTLEVLDWGGTGDYFVLLTGLGDNAHVFDNFAYQFNDLFHVIGITRRGFGKSSKPEDGYSEEIRVRDYISILDQLNISKASFAGHSIACGELNYLGSHYQDRINKLVYIDGLDYGVHKSLKQPPGLDFTDADVTSLEHFIAVNVRYNGYREPNAAYCDTYTIDAEGKVTGTISPPEATAKIIAGSVTTDYSLITAPVLGIFETWTMDTRLPYYWYLDKEKQAEYDRSWVILFDWRAKQLNRIRTEIKNSRIIEFQEF
jgi:pimeloyl-ACP methyl ester carboxylesterase